MIHMQINYEDISFLVGSYETIEEMVNVPALPIFDDIIIRFLSKLSNRLLRDKNVKGMKDVVSYAYWIRKASLMQERSRYHRETNRIGRGVAFHVTPSNVPVNFAVSMTSSLLAGNGTIIRVSEKQFEQVRVICEIINALIEEECNDIKSYICIIRYKHSEEITNWLSSLCDLRVVWGGDRTISEIRKSPLPPRAVEMTFADRHSLAIIDSEYYLKQDLEDIAQKFYTDTFYTDQNACSSPRLVVWMGNKIKEASNVFWREIEKLALSNYDLKPIQAVDKAVSFSLVSMNRNVTLESNNNYIVRIEVDELTPDLMDYKQSGGYFFEYYAKDLHEIIPVLTKQCQTISVLGIDKDDVKDLVLESGVRGVDRIVRLGQTMGLEFIWDGFDMIEAMSRCIYVYN